MTHIATAWLEYTGDIYQLLRCNLSSFAIFKVKIVLKRWLWGKQSFQNMSCKNEKEMVNAWLMISLLTSLTPGRQCAIYRENTHINLTKKGSSGRINSIFTKMHNFWFCDVIHLLDRLSPFVRIYPAKDKAIYVSMPLNMCRPMEVNISLIATTILREMLMMFCWDFEVDAWSRFWR